MLFGSVFMRRITLSQTWVKNVYSLCASGVGKCVNLYTALYKSAMYPQPLRVQTPSFTQVMDTFPPILYTPIFGQLTDVNFQFSTVSTAPIIKKKR